MHLRNKPHELRNSSRVPADPPAGSSGKPFAGVPNVDDSESGKEGAIRIKLLWSTIGVAGLIGGWMAVTPAAPPPAGKESAPVPAPAGDALERGKKLFATHCAGCHGAEGRADGLAAQYLFPKPRHFGYGQFRVISGRSGDLPTEQDLYQVITNGMPGSAMPSWELLPEHDRWAIAKYVKTLVRTYDEDEEKWVNLYDLRGEPKPVEIGTAPPRTAERIARGKAIYLGKGDCIKCHGPEGRGDGPSAAEQKDEQGYPLLPRDFSEGIFKGGDRPEDLFRRISFGIGPMPAHEATLTADERWDVAFYVLSLVKPEAQRMAQQRRRTIVARRTAGEIPHDPADPFWTERPATYLPLMQLWWRKERVEGVLVTSAHNGSEIALRLEWVDTTDDEKAQRAHEFRDGVAVQFAKNADTPFIAMGADGEKVNIWFWKSDRQAPPTLPETYPNMVVDDYPGLKDWKPGEGFSAQGRPIQDHDPKFMSGWGVGNVVSDPTRTSPVENLSASGFSTLASMGKDAQTVSGRGVWDRGVWRVVLWRSFRTPNKEDIELAPGRRVPAAFAIWNGSHRDRNGQKAITIWHDLEVEW